MSKIIVSLLIIYLSIISTYQQCGCGPNQAYSNKLNKCLKYPKEGEEGYSEGCKMYNIVDEDDWICFQCETSYYKAPGPSCIKTDLVGCNSIRQSLNQNPINMRFLSNSKNNYICRGCDSSQNYYLKNDKCEENPKQGDENYVANCDQYIYYNQNHKLQCNKCEEGYYRNMQLQCIRNPSYPNQCKVFQITRDNVPWCQICKPGYAATRGNKCANEETLIQNCKYYYMSTQSPNIVNYCSQCKSGYHPNVDETQCESNPQQGQQNYVKNCARYAYSYQKPKELQCKQCESNHVFDSQINECVQVAQVVGNCKKYVYKGQSSDQEQCYQCQNGFQTLFNQERKIIQCNKCPDPQDI